MHYSTTKTVMSTRAEIMAFALADSNIKQRESQTWKVGICEVYRGVVARRVGVVEAHLRARQRPGGAGWRVGVLASRRAASASSRRACCVVPAPRRAGVRAARRPRRRWAVRRPCRFGARHCEQADGRGGTPAVAALGAADGRGPSRREGEGGVRHEA